MKLQSSFLGICTNPGDFEKVSTLDEYLAISTKQAADNHNNVHPDLYIAAAWEAFSEYLLRTFTKHFGVKKGSIKIDHEKNRGQSLFCFELTGVRAPDVPLGFACGVYHPDPSKNLSTNADGLNELRVLGFRRGAKVKDGRQKLLVISNALEVNQHSAEVMLNNRIRFVLKNEIEEMVNVPAVFQDFVKQLKKVSMPLPNAKVLRQHQKDGVQMMLKNPKGIIQLPTASGKSLIGADYIRAVIHGELPEPVPECPVFFIATPSIVLTYQLLGVVASHLLHAGIRAQYFNLSSGYAPELEHKLLLAMRQQVHDVSEVPFNTSPNELKKFYELAVQRKVPMIISGTYHSAIRVTQSGIPIHTMLADESHNLVGGRLSEVLRNAARHLVAHRKYFFTATPMHSTSDKGQGMNNQQIFGKIIYSKLHAELVAVGEIISPLLFTVDVSTYQAKLNAQKPFSAENSKETNFERDISVHMYAIEETLKRLEQWKTKKSAQPGMLGVKLLVTTRGSQHFEKLMTSQAMPEFRKRHPNYHVIGMSTDYMGFIDGEHIQSADFKERCMDAIYSLKEHENAVVFHIAMLSEGVNFPQLWATLPFRDMGKIAFLQNTGRGTRLHDIDRENLYSGKIKVTQRSRFIKPNSIVIIPKFFDDSEDFLKLCVKIVEEMRNAYGDLPFEKYNHGEFEGWQEKVQIPLAIMKEGDYEKLEFRWQTEILKALRRKNAQEYGERRHHWLVTKARAV